MAKSECEKQILVRANVEQLECGRDPCTRAGRAIIGWRIVLARVFPRV